MIGAKGGRCQVCRYDRCLAALCFHHREPSEKAFRISGSHGRSWSSLQQELEKCDLLCLNCHLEIHARDELFGRQKRIRGVAPGQGTRCRCVGCGRSYIHDFRKGHTRSLCNSCRSNVGGRSARESLKRRMVDYRGGRCEACGYDRCLRALCFHHREGTSKRFPIASSHLRSWDSLRRELDGCVLLCHNCHAEAHSRHVSSDDAGDEEARSLTLKARSLNAH